jgi:hypothetical protein
LGRPNGPTNAILSLVLFRQKAADTPCLSRGRKVKPVEGFERPSHIPLEGWVGEGRGGEMIELRAHVSERAVKSFELATLFGRIEADPGGRGIIEVRVPSSGIDFYAARLLGLGTDVRVESPPELIAAMRQKAWAIARLYPRGADPELDPVRRVSWLRIRLPSSSRDLAPRTGPRGTRGTADTRGRSPTSLGPRDLPARPRWGGLPALITHDEPLRRFRRRAARRRRTRGRTPTRCRCR